MKRFKQILCVVDSYDLSLTALKQAQQLAKKHQASLRVISIIKKSGAYFPFIQNKVEINKAFNKHLVAKLKELSELVNTHCQDIKTDTEVLVGISFIEIIRDVLRHKVDLLVKCSLNESWLERLFGSDDMHILRKCPCPVLMLKPGHLEPCLNILATVDIMNDDFDEEKKYRVQDELNSLVLEHASSFALFESAQLHIGSVWDSLGENFLRYGAVAQTSEDTINRYVEQTHREYKDKLEELSLELKALIGNDALDYIRPITHLVKGLPAKEIPLMTQKYDIDLIVMGTVARTGISGLFIGNTAEAILEQVQCSVLAIKPKGFETPVTLCS
jgi:universal stress protein E